MNYSLGENIAYNIINFSEGDFGIKESLAKAAVIGSMGLSALGLGMAGNSIGSRMVPQGQRPAIESIERAADDKASEAANALIESKNKEYKQLMDKSDRLRQIATDKRNKATKTRRAVGAVAGAITGLTASGAAAHAVNQRRKFNKAVDNILDKESKSNK